MHALGLGELRVSSSLGQPLRASVTLLSDGVNEVTPSCFKAKIESADGSFLGTPEVQMPANRQGKLLTLSTRQTIAEPAIKITVDAACGSQLHREYLALLDPPSLTSSANEMAATDKIVAPEVALAASTTAEPERRSVRRKAATTQVPAAARPVSDAALNADRAPEISATVAKTPPPNENVRSKSKKAPVEASKRKDVLKLSDDSFVLPAGLRLSDSLSTPTASLAQLDELRAAQARMAAILRDENPDTVVKPVPDQAAIQQANQQANQQAALREAQLKEQLRQKQTAASKAAAASENMDGTQRNWVLFLGVLLLVGVVLVVVLLLYIARLQKRIDYSWWSHETESEEPQRPQNLSEIVDTVQASYDASLADKLYEPRVIIAPLTPGTDKATAKKDGKEAKQSGTSKGNAAALTVDSTLPKFEDSIVSSLHFFSTRGNSVNVEEISDVTQEAEFWISVNDLPRAIEILEPQVEIAHPDSPMPWLYLLDLYRSTKNKEKFDALKARFSVFFNAKIPDYDSRPVADEEHQLEDFPHLIQRICLLWGSHEIIPFLEMLLLDDREGTRNGFDLAVYRDILLLIGIAHELERTKPPTDVVSDAPQPYSGHEGIDFEIIDFKKDL